MKVTFIEEIESHRAWFQHMFCPQCDEGTYKVHHQLEPVEERCWWITCPNCGFESAHSTTYQLATSAWAKGEEE